MNDTPMVRLELERMKLTIMNALAAHTSEINSMIQSSVDEFCTPAHLNRLINRQVEESITKAVKDGIDGYFRYGNGQKEVKAAILKQMELDRDV